MDLNSFHSFRAHVTLSLGKMNDENDIDIRLLFKWREHLDGNNNFTTCSICLFTE